jgi:hypothetical protein
LITSKSKAHDDQDQLLVTNLNKEGAAKMTAHILMPLTKTGLNPKSIDLLTSCVKTQSKKDSATRSHAEGSMENGPLRVKFARQRSMEKYALS